MKIGVIGYGSIGKRHVNNLLLLGYSDIVLLREQGEGNEHGLKECHSWADFMSHDFDFVILSNPTAAHAKYLEKLLATNQNVLVEKPVVNTLAETESLRKLVEKYTGSGMVAYNTRFHPCVDETNILIGSNVLGRPLYAHFFIGQYLPDWRPGQDYSTSVSAIRALGGGVASELIHEVDLALEFFGRPKSNVNSIITKISDLLIETEDTADYQYISEQNVVVTIHMDYYYQGYKRYFEIVGSKANLFCDLFTASIIVTGKNNQILIHKNFNEFQRNDMYLAMIRYFVECIEKHNPPKPSLSEGLISVEIVEKAKINNNILE